MQQPVAQQFRFGLGQVTLEEGGHVCPLDVLDIRRPVRVVVARSRDLDMLVDGEQGLQALPLVDLTRLPSALPSIGQDV